VRPLQGDKLGGKSPQTPQERTVTKNFYTEPVEVRNLKLETRNLYTELVEVRNPTKNNTHRPVSFF